MAKRKSEGEEKKKGNEGKHCGEKKAGKERERRETINN